MTKALVDERSVDKATSRAEDPDRMAIRKVLAGEAAAYAVIVDRHERSITRMITGILADRHLAEDVVQEVMLIAYRRLADFRGESAFGTWLARIAVREALRQRKRIAKLRRRTISFDDLDESRHDRDRRRGVAVRTGVGDLERVLAVVGKLPDRERAALVLHAVDGRPYVEIGEILGAPIGTVGSLISRARARLRKLLPDSSGER